MDISAILPVSTSTNQYSALSTSGSSESSSSSASSSESTTTSRTTSLGQEDFLNLLVVQLTNQNPMEPMADTEFISQMANFSSLEQATAMYESFEDFSSKQIAITTQGYLDREVDIETAAGESVSGIVDEVSLTGDTIQVKIDGVFYDATDIIAVRSKN